MDSSSLTAQQSTASAGAISAHSLSPPKQRKALREAVAVFGIWTLIALLAASYTSLNRLHVNQDAEWTRSLVLNLIDWNILAVFTLILLRLVRRWPLGLGHWRHVPMYIAAILVLVMVKYAVYFPARQFFYPDPAFNLRHAILQHLFWEVFELATLVGLVHAVEYGRSLQEGRLRAAQLESHLTNARLEVLRSELQPHFLFNALHAISTLMHRDVEAADEMVTQLGDLLRLTLERKSVQEVPLREELSVLEPYLKILRIRFGDRLTISVDVDPSLLEVRVPLFILQPLVENAIHHGIAHRAGAGRIDIRARGVGDSVQITVSDDGAGLASAATGQGIGLSNTRLRLEQLYGPGGQLVLKGHPEQGAQAIISIPKSRPKPGDRVA